jgi:hypothetical protein
VGLDKPIRRAGSTGSEPITTAPRSRTHDRASNPDIRRALWGAPQPVSDVSPMWTDVQRQRREVWTQQPKEKSSYGSPVETFAQRRHREVWED